VGDKMMVCMMKNDCIKFPPTNVTCPRKEFDSVVQADSGLHNLEGEWWQHYGYNKLFDCYDCQHIHSMVRNGSHWYYTYSYELFKTDGTLKFYKQTWQLNEQERGKVQYLEYEYLGTLHEEEWWIARATDRYVIVNVCSYMFQYNLI
jgi:hypothetical protein